MAVRVPTVQKMQSGQALIGLIKLLRLPYHRRLGLAAALLGVLLSSCAIPQYGPVMDYAPTIAPGGVAVRLQPGDQLKIIVYGEDTLSGVYEISPAGTISMPLIGPIGASGLSRGDLEGVLKAAYANGRLLQSPQITVSVAAYRPFYILGEVQTPGKYPYTTGIDVLTAVATAGGFTYRANRETVLIRHPGEVVWRENALATPVPIVPGDLIRVVERFF